MATSCRVEVEDRLDYELSVISQDGLRRLLPRSSPTSSNGRRARGSASAPDEARAAGTITCYCLGITTLDPIKYGLVFERFLNPERREMPDFDIDFDERYRGEVITVPAAEVRRGPRRADRHVRDDQGQVRDPRLRPRARLPVRHGRPAREDVPALELGKDPSLKDCFEKSKDPRWTYAYNEAAEMRKAYEEETDARRVLDAARKLEGLRRQTGVHAAAVVVGREPLVNFTALQRTDNEATSSRSTRCTRSRSSASSRSTSSASAT